MSDGVLDACCLVAVTACYEVCAGACFDFTTIRQPFTQCFWRCGRRSADSDSEEEEDEEDGGGVGGERRPLIRPGDRGAVVSKQPAAKVASVRPGR